MTQAEFESAIFGFAGWSETQLRRSARSKSDPKRSEVTPIVTVIVTAAAAARQPASDRARVTSRAALFSTPGAHAAQRWTSKPERSSLEGVLRRPSNGGKFIIVTGPCVPA